jgi:hypothetical protein
MKDIIPLEQIPQGVLDEFAHCFETVTWENYGLSPTSEVETRRLKFKRFIADNVEGIVLNPTTFEPKTIVGKQQEEYLVRGIIKENYFDVYAVISLGILVSNGVEE